MTENFSPAVSVIVPVYNAEKYLPACLESILIQTFTDFEVLAVDDCSTDSSVEVAESYLEKFGGRLKIISLPENTGSGVVPRSIGFDLSQGKYVYFVDNDDLLVDDALETLYTAAEKYSADVVYMGRYLSCGAEPVPKDATVVTWGSMLISEEPVLDVDDFASRIKNFSNSSIAWSPWAKFVRRDFLVDNQIKFSSLRVLEDGIWTFKLLCFAKNWLRLSKPLYFYRQTETSLTHNVNRTAQEEIKFWLNPLLNGTQELDEFMKRFEFFKRHREYRLRVIHSFVNPTFHFMSDAFKQLSIGELYELFLQEILASDKDNSVLWAYLLFIANVYRNELKK